MAEPTNITNNAATIYSADLLYEQNCKCGEIEVLSEDGVWKALDGDRVWRIDVLNNGDISGRPNTVFGVLEAKNISPNNCNKLVATRYIYGQTIMGDFTTIIAGNSPGTCLILYKDCKQS